MLSCTRPCVGAPETPLIASSILLLEVKVFAAVQVVVAGVALLTPIALQLVTPVPLIVTSAVKLGVPVPLV